MNDSTPGFPSRRRFRGRTVAIVLAVIIVLAISGAMARFYATRAPTGDVVGLVALAGDGALLFREADDDPFFEVEMVEVDREDGPRWRKGLYRLQLPPPDGVTVDEDTITIRASDVDGHLETHAFARDGAFLWRRRAYETAPDDWQEGAASYRVGDSLVEIYGGSTGVAHVLGIDAEDRGPDSTRDGETRFRIDLPGGAPTDSRVVSSGVLIRRGAQAWLLRVAEGELQPVVGEGAVCLLDGGAIAQAGSDVVFFTAAEPPKVVASGVTLSDEVSCLRRGPYFAFAEPDGVTVYAEGAVRWQVAGPVRVPSGRWIEGDVQDDIAAFVGDRLRVWKLEIGSETDGPTVEGASPFQLVAYQGHLYVRFADQLAIVGQSGVQVTVGHAPAGRFPLSRAHIARGRMWLANPADARPVDPVALRPLRSLALLPAVTAPEGEILSTDD